MDDSPAGGGSIRGPTVCCIVKVLPVPSMDQDGDCCPLFVLLSRHFSSDRQSINCRDDEEGDEFCSVAFKLECDRVRDWCFVV